jgi:hypothetical protein
MQMTIRHISNKFYCIIGVLAVVLMVVALGGCLPSWADRWNPPSEIHSAIYRKDAKSLQTVIARDQASMNRESTLSFEPFWRFVLILPLSLALEREWREGVMILLANGADAGMSESSGWTPMARAINLGDLESVRLFLDHGASPRQRAIYRDGSLSRSPLDYAVLSVNGDLGIFQLLVTYGAVPEEDLSVESKIRLKELSWLNK